MWCYKRKRIQQTSEVLDISRARCPRVLFTPTGTVPCLQVVARINMSNHGFVNIQKEAFQGGLSHETKLVKAGRPYAKAR